MGKASAMPGPVAISRFGVFLCDASGECQKFRLRCEQDCVAGYVELGRDAGRIDLELKLRGELLDGVASWRRGDALLLPRRVEFRVAPRTSKPYPRVGEKRD